MELQTARNVASGNSNLVSLSSLLQVQKTYLRFSTFIYYTPYNSIGSFI